MNQAQTLQDFDLFEELETLAGNLQLPKDALRGLQVSFGDRNFKTHGEIRVGRCRDNDVQVHDPTVSRRHCRLSLQGDKFLVEDLGSTHGTWVNGKRIQQALLDGTETLTVGMTEVNLSLCEHV
jgi:pSer/pThr/pTyr-binding forkhead associated (FHA) protein